MKKCGCCKVDKSLNNFNKDKAKKDGLQSYCRECASDIKRKEYWRKKSESDGLFSVYYLPEEHYVGITGCVWQRMRDHRNKGKKITEGYEIIAKFERAVDAHLMETLFHVRGYNGFSL